MAIHHSVPRPAVWPEVRGSAARDGAARRGKQAKPEPRHFLRVALRVIKVATDLNADLGKALFWYRNEPFSAFGYKTAGRLVSEGPTDDLLR